MHTPLLLGHRGAPRAHRENTLRGFQAALDAGLHGVELDVRRCADGTLVVHHDEALFDGRRIADLTPAQLNPHPVPLLAEVLAWAADTGAYVNVEIKYERGTPDDRAPNTARLIRRHGLQRQVIVSSFNPLVLAAHRAFAPEIELGLLFHRPWRVAGADALVPAARALGVRALHPHHSLVTPELMAVAGQYGWRVNVWTVNDPGVALGLLDLGVHALIGDEPAVLRAAAERTPT